MLPALKVLNRRLNYICTWIFPSVGSGVLCTWNDAGPLQVKYTRARFFERHYNFNGMLVGCNIPFADSWIL